MKNHRYRNGKIFYFAACLLLLAGMTIGCKGKPAEQAIERPVITGVTVSPVSPSTVDEIYTATGTVRADNTSVIASRVMGTVNAVYVREGDSVRAGQLLMTIDDRDAAQRERAANMAVESANQNRDLAEKTWQRYKNLYDEKALTRQEMDQIETQKKVADAEYERAKAMAQEAKTYLSFTRVTAPVSGRITEKRIDVGSMATPGTPLLVMESNGSYYIESSLDAAWVKTVKTGMPVVAVIETLAQPLQGKIREVLPSVDPLSRTFTIKVYIRNAPVRSGLFARVQIPVGKKEAIIVPPQAVVQKGQLTGVYTVDSRGLVTYRLVRLGNHYAGGVEILSGLNANDRIITAGMDRVTDGGMIAGEKTK